MASGPATGFFSSRAPRSKGDQLGLTFGDKDIVLNWHDDDLNFPRALAELELALPVRGAARKNTPMFTVDESHAFMAHAFADVLSRALVNHALVGDVANMLSLHGGRIFLAVALRARGYGVGMIKAICRWKRKQAPCSTRGCCKTNTWRRSISR